MGEEFRYDGTRRCGDGSWNLIVMRTGVCCLHMNSAGNKIVFAREGVLGVALIIYV